MSDPENTKEVEIIESEFKAFDFSPAIFDPNQEQLKAIAAEVASITADPEKMTKADLELVNTTKNKLVKARTQIQKIGKAAREGAVTYQKQVIEYEKLLIGIIEPEEKRLKEIESGAKEYAMTQERLKTLPEYKEKLASIGDGVLIDDTFLLSLDPNQRDMYYNQRLGAKLEADKAEIERKQAAENAEKDAVEAEKLNNRIQIMLELGFKRGVGEYLLESVSGQIKVSINEIIILDEPTFLKSVDNWKSIAEAFKASEIKAAEDRAKKEAEQKAENEKAEEEAKRKAEEDKKKAEQQAELEAKEKREKEDKYSAWLLENSYNADTDHVEFNNGVSTLYRKVSSFNHN